MVKEQALSLRSRWLCLCFTLFLSPAWAVYYYLSPDGMKAVLFLDLKEGAVLELFTQGSLAGLPETAQPPLVMNTLQGQGGQTIEMGGQTLQGPLLFVSSEEAEVEFRANGSDGIRSGTPAKLTLRDPATVTVRNAQPLQPLSPVPAFQWQPLTIEARRTQLTAIHEGMEFNGMSPIQVYSKKYHVFAVYLQFGSSMPQLSDDTPIEFELILSATDPDINFYIEPDRLEQIHPGRWRAVFGKTLAGHTSTTVSVPVRYNQPMAAYTPRGSDLLVDTHRSKLHIGDWSISLEGKVDWEGDEASMPQQQYVVDGFFYHSRPESLGISSEPRTRLWLFNQEGSSREIPPEPSPVIFEEKEPESLESSSTSDSLPVDVDKSTSPKPAESGVKKTKGKNKKKKGKAKEQTAVDVPVSDTAVTEMTVVVPSEGDLRRGQKWLESFFGFSGQSFSMRVTGRFEEDLAGIHGLFDMINQDAMLMSAATDEIRQKVVSDRWEVFSPHILKFFVRFSPLQSYWELSESKARHERMNAAKYFLEGMTSQLSDDYLLDLGILLATHFDIASSIMSYARILRADLNQEVVKAIKTIKTFPDPRSSGFLGDFDNVPSWFALYWHAGYFEAALSLLDQQTDFLEKLVNTKKTQLERSAPKELTGMKQGWVIFQTDPRIIPMFSEVYWPMLRFYFSFLRFYDSELMAVVPEEHLKSLHKKLARLQAVAATFEKHYESIMVACEIDQYRKGRFHPKTMLEPGESCRSARDTMLLEYLKSQKFSDLLAKLEVGASPVVEQGADDLSLERVSLGEAPKAQTVVLAVETMNEISMLQQQVFGFGTGLYQALVMREKVEPGDLKQGGLLYMRLKEAPDDPLFSARKKHLLEYYTAVIDRSIRQYLLANLVHPFPNLDHYDPRLQRSMALDQWVMLHGPDLRGCRDSGILPDLQLLLMNNVDLLHDISAFLDVYKEDIRQCLDLESVKQSLLGGQPDKRAMYGEYLLYGWVLLNAVVGHKGNVQTGTRDLLQALSRLQQKDIGNRAYMLSVIAQSIPVIWYTMSWQDMLMTSSDLRLLQIQLGLFKGVAGKKFPEWAVFYQKTEVDPKDKEVRKNMLSGEKMFSQQPLGMDVFEVMLKHHTCLAKAFENGLESCQTACREAVDYLEDDQNYLVLRTRPYGRYLKGLSESWIDTCQLAPWDQQQVDMELADDRGLGRHLNDFNIHVQHVADTIKPLTTNAQDELLEKLDPGQQALFEKEMLQILDRSLGFFKSLEVFLLDRRAATMLDLDGMSMQSRQMFMMMRLWKLADRFGLNPDLMARYRTDTAEMMKLWSKNLLHLIRFNYRHEDSGSAIDWVRREWLRHKPLLFTYYARPLMTQPDAPQPPEFIEQIMSMVLVDLATGSSDGQTQAMLSWLEAQLTLLAKQGDAFSESLSRQLVRLLKCFHFRFDSRLKPRIVALMEVVLKSKIDPRYQKMINEIIENISGREVPPYVSLLGRDPLHFLAECPGGKCSGGAGSQSLPASGSDELQSYTLELLKWLSHYEIQIEPVNKGKLGFFNALANQLGMSGKELWRILVDLLVARRELPDDVSLRDILNHTGGLPGDGYLKLLASKLDRPIVLVRPKNDKGQLMVMLVDPDETITILEEGDSLPTNALVVIQDGQGNFFSIGAVISWSQMNAQVNAHLLHLIKQKKKAKEWTYMIPYKRLMQMEYTIRQNALSILMAFLLFQWKEIH